MRRLGLLSPNIFLKKYFSLLPPKLDINIRVVSPPWYWLSNNLGGQLYIKKRHGVRQLESIQIASTANCFHGRYDVCVSKNDNTRLESFIFNMKRRTFSIPISYYVFGPTNGCDVSETTRFILVFHLVFIYPRVLQVFLALTKS